MNKIAVSYKIGADNKLIMPQLHWPNACPCCGRPNPAATFSLHHVARGKSETISTGISTSTTKSGYPLSWIIPYCDACLLHSKKFISPWAPLLILLFLFWFGLGYLLFLLGLGNNPIANVGFVVAIALSTAGAYFFGRWFNNWQTKRIKKLMLSDCSHPHYAVEITSSPDVIIFGFYNADYAKQFATINHAG